MGGEGRGDGRGGGGEGGGKVRWEGEDGTLPPSPILSPFTINSFIVGQTLQVKSP